MIASRCRPRPITCALLLLSAIIACKASSSSAASSSSRQRHSAAVAAHRRRRRRATHGASSSRTLIPRGGDRQRPPMPSEPPPPPPDIPSDVMGGYGKATPLPGQEAPPPPPKLDKKKSWRSGKFEDAEEDYGFDTLKAKTKPDRRPSLLRQISSETNDGATTRPQWSAYSDQDTATATTDETSTPDLADLPPPPALALHEKLLAGGISRAIAQCFLYPVDALRTLAQTRDHRTLADVGTSALVRGCATTSSFALFIGSIQFGIFGATRSVCGPVVASALGAAGSCLVSVPQEVIKQRLVTGIYSGFREACSTIYKTEGFPGFYSAWKPTVARNVPFVVATFTSNDILKRAIIKRRRLRQGKNWAGDAGGSGGGDNDDASSNELTILENLVVGITSALIGAVLTHPADVVKTRMMTQAASVQVPYSSAWNCIVTMAKTEGASAFYAGFVQRSLYMGPLWALQFAINGRLCKTLEQRNAKRMNG